MYVTMHCTKMYDLKVNFQGPNVPKRVQLWCFATFADFLKERRNSFFIYSFLGDIDYCQEMDLIELC